MLERNSKFVKDLQKKIWHKNRKHVLELPGDFKDQKEKLHQIFSNFLGVEGYKTLRSQKYPFFLSRIKGELYFALENINSVPGTSFRA